MNPKLSHPHIGPTPSATFFESKSQREHQEDNLYLIGLAVVFIVVGIHALLTA